MRRVYDCKLYTSVKISLEVGVENGSWLGQETRIPAGACEEVSSDFGLGGRFPGALWLVMSQYGRKVTIVKISISY